MLYVNPVREENKKELNIQIHSKRAFKKLDKQLNVNSISTQHDHHPTLIATKGLTLTFFFWTFCLRLRLYTAEEEEAFMVQRIQQKQSS